MNKKTFWTLLVLLTVILTACATNTAAPVLVPNIAPTEIPPSSAPNSPANEEPSNTQADTAPLFTGPSSIGLPPQTMLILGLMKLEGTAQAITIEQATTLLPMVYVLQGLNDSDSAAPEEVDSLLGQIQATLSADQIQAIRNMSFTAEDVLVYQVKREDARDGEGSGPGVPGGPPKEGEDDKQVPTVDTSTTGDADNALTETPAALFETVIGLLQGKIQ